jgi:uncharacterized protein (TIGR03435 family)
VKRALFLFAATAFAQTFDVASVKPSPSGSAGRSLTEHPGARLTTSGATVKMLIFLAYQLMPDQVSGGPAWVESDSFDIDARAADPKVTRAEFRQMVQNLLADRFQLKVHRATKELPVYALVVARNGPKLVDAKNDDGDAGMRIEGPGRMTGVKATMPMFANTLSKPLRRHVVDETGLKGAYSFHLDFVPDQKPVMPGDTPPPDRDGPSIFTALQEQLGLSLKATKGPVDVLVIDRAEKPSAN